MGQLLPNSAPQFIKTSSLEEGKKWILERLTATAKTLQIESNNPSTRVHHIRDKYYSMYDHMDAFFDTHYPNTSAKERFALRRKFFFNPAGISDGRPREFSHMNFEEILEEVITEKYKTIGEIPYKMYQRLLGQKWMDALRLKHPFTGAYISYAGHFCQSEYELLIANLLYELFKTEKVKIQTKYPFHHELNSKNQSLTCDFSIQVDEINYFIEVWMFQLDQPPTWEKGIGSAGKPYLEKRERKIKLLQFHEEIKLVSIEVGKITGGSKNIDEFFKGALNELCSVFKININELDPQKINSRHCRTNYAPKDPDNLAEAERLILAASKMLKIDQSNLDRIYNQMESGQSAKIALKYLGLTEDSLLGLCRLYKKKCWQVKLPREMKKTLLFRDHREGFGFSRLSFAKAISCLLNSKEIYFSQFSNFPTWVQNHIKINSKIGSLGVFGINFRAPRPKEVGETTKPAHYANINSQTIQKHLKNNKTVSKAIHFASMEIEIRDFLKILSSQLSNALLLDWPIAGSQELMDNKFLLIDPNEAQLIEISQDICNRIRKVWQG